MTMNELVEYIASDLNTPSPESKTRIGHTLNVRYKQVSSSIGLNPTRKEEISATATIGSQSITFTGTEKLDAVFRRVNSTRVVPLKEITEHELNEMTPKAEPATKFCIYSIGPQSVTIKVDCTPTTEFTLYASVLGDATTLTNNDQPRFPESYHDILIHGVKADEHRRREKFALAKEEELMFQQRLSDLRMFIAKSAYLDIYPNKNQGPEDWWDYESKKY